MTLTVVKLVNVGRTGCCSLFLTEVGSLETEDDMCLFIFTNFWLLPCKLILKSRKKGQFEGRFI